MSVVADIELYLNAKYAILIRELTPEEGGGFMAVIPQLGSYTFAADGDTLEEALVSLEWLRRHLIPELLLQGVDLPLPAREYDWLEIRKTS